VEEKGEGQRLHGGFKHMKLDRGERRGEGKFSLGCVNFCDIGAITNHIQWGMIT
jgi:hypothetical protein